MRLLLAAIFLSALLSVALASTLQANDTMAAWRNASSEERVALLDQLKAQMSSGTARADVLRCLNDTSKVSGHGDLPIVEVAKACAEPKAGDAI